MTTRGKPVRVAISISNALCFRFVFIVLVLTESFRSAIKLEKRENRKN